jgi:arsenate reductase
MKIFFLSCQNSCRSQIAEALLRKCDPLLEVYSAGIEPTDHVSSIAIEVLEEIGIDLKQHVPQHYSKFSGLEFDYLITVGDGTQEELTIPAIIKFKRKMHLGFQNPYKKSDDIEKVRELCREIRDEIGIEIYYFYHKILKSQQVGQDRIL